MTMSVKEFGHLKKFMMMTTSDNEQEALTALRMANNILKKHNVNWDAVFARLVKVGNQIESADDVEAKVMSGQRSSRVRITEALEIAMTNATGSFYSFLHSLSEQFENTGRLTQAQEDAIIKSAQRAGWRG